MAADLRNVDLNLLVALRLLLQTRSVSRAAESLNVTQPAMSNTLGRLRAVFGDPLLVRGPGGMVPTALATALEQPICEVLQRLQEDIFKAKAFDPNTATRLFTIGVTDYAEITLVPDVVARVAGEAPACRFAFRNLPAYTPWESLALGELDLCLTYSVDAKPGLVKRALIHDRFVCIVRRDHPEVGKRLTLKKFAKLKHALVSPLLERGGDMRGIVDDALAKHDLKREVMVSIPHFFAAPFIVAKSDYVMTIATRIAAPFREHLGLRVVEAPVELPEFQTNLVWHERNDRDPAVTWLRRLIGELV